MKRPPEWERVQVVDILAPGPNAAATGPFGSSISARHFRATGVPVIRGGNLSADSAIRLRDEDLAFLDEGKAAEFSRSRATRGDLVFTCWGTINQVGLIDETAAYPAYIVSNKQMKLTPDTSRVSPTFLYYLFSGPAMQREILAGAIGTSVPGFNLTRLKGMTVALPPLEEQHCIAEALEDADRLIAALEHLIAKKQDVMRGLMQNLLTGRRRLPGFDGAWERGIVSDYVTIRRGEALTGRDAHPGEFPLVAAGKEAAGRIDRANRSGPVITVSASGAYAGYVRYWSEAIFASDCSTIEQRDATVDLKFVYYQLRRGQKAIYGLQSGGAQPHVHARDLYPLSFRVPSDGAERVAICEVLDGAAREIELLRSRRDKAIAIKQGMMQQLLTGRTRLPVTEDVAA